MVVLFCFALSLVPVAASQQRPSDAILFITWMKECLPSEEPPTHIGRFSGDAGVGNGSPGGRVLEAGVRGLKEQGHQLIFQHKVLGTVVKEGISEEVMTPKKSIWMVEFIFSFSVTTSLQILRRPDPCQHEPHNVPKLMPQWVLRRPDARQEPCGARFSTPKCSFDVWVVLSFLLAFLKEQKF